MAQAKQGMTRAKEGEITLLRRHRQNPKGNGKIILN